jgi:excisionase family DNA binding protein
MMTMSTQAVASPARPALVSLAGTAHQLSKSVGYIRSLIRDGKLPSVRLGKCVMIRQSDIDAIVENGVR